MYMYELGQYNSTDATEMSVPVCALWLVDTILGIWSSYSHKMLVSSCAIYELTGLLLSVVYCLSIYLTGLAVALKEVWLLSEDGEEPLC